MKKELLLGAVVVILAMVLLFVFRNITNQPVQNGTPEGKAGKEHATGKSNATGPAGSGQNKGLTLDKNAAAVGGAAGHDKSGNKGITVAGDTGQNTGGSGAESQGAEPQTTSGEEGQLPVIITLGEQTSVLATVNNQPVTITDIMPPGSFEPGDVVEEKSYKALIEKAVDQSLLVQKAGELGLSENEKYKEGVDFLRQQYEELELGDTPEEREWLIQNQARAALISELLSKEGLVPERVSDEEVREFYENNSVEYNWLREREAARGATPAAVERMVKEQIRRDLEEPMMREAGEKQKEYIESLREKADIQYLQ